MNPDEMHKKGNELRESGNFEESLKCCDEACVGYAKANNSKMLADALASRALTFRHMAAVNNDNMNFLILAKFSAKAGVKVIENSGSTEGKSVPLYTLGKVQISMGKLDKAAESISEAIASASGNGSEVAEMKTRLDALNYQNGDSNALESFNADVEDLENGQFEDEYVKNVWVSGAYMHMADAMKAKGENDKAREMISKARTIIDADARLTLRAAQLAKVEEGL